MSHYIDFQNYSLEKVSRGPIRSKVIIQEQTYIFEISLNRSSRNLYLGILDSEGTNYLAYLPITAGVNLAATISDSDFPSNIMVFGAWNAPSTAPLIESFMKELRIYVEEVV